MTKYLKYIYSVVLFAACWWWWAVPNRGALNYQEEFQLFLMDWDYFLATVGQKGGLAVYISEFLVQFYNNYWIGAAVVAGEILQVYLLSRKIVKTVFRKCGEFLACLLALIPALGAVYELGDVNTMHSLLIAIIEELAFLYMLILVFTSKKLSRIARYSLCVVLLPIFAAIYIWTAGLNHYRLKTESFSASNVYNAKTYELLDYDLLVRTNNWRGIIDKAEKKQPVVPMTVCATNLALGMTNQLGEKANKFYQHGVEGLFPPFKREVFTSLTIAEVYFQLGLINTAQRIYFEAMEGLPNYKKSSRCIRRLAETNLINGQYEVAKKYLRMLKKTMFYSRWAERMLKLIDEGELAINSHQLYGQMREKRLQEDFLFSEQEMDKILGQLFWLNPSNTLATQYFLLYPLLENDMEKFVQYMQVVDSRMPFNSGTEPFRKYLHKKQ